VTDDREPKARSTHGSSKSTTAAKPADPDLLSDFKALLNAGLWKKARVRLQTAYTAEPDKSVRKWMREVLLLQIGEAKGKQTREANRKRKQAADDPRPAMVPAKCRTCGLTFERAESDPKRDVCGVCRPARSDSVRTVSGGAPTLGRRQR
jgi:predicted Zn-ribbon and HTH transcriptional regulator